MRESFGQEAVVCNVEESLEENVDGAIRGLVARIQCLEELVFGEVQACTAEYSIIVNRVAALHNAVPQANLLKVDAEHGHTKEADTLHCLRAKRQRTAL